MVSWLLRQTHAPVLRVQVTVKTTIKTIGVSPLGPVSGQPGASKGMRSQKNQAMKSTSVKN